MRRRTPFCCFALPDRDLGRRSLSTWAPTSRAAMTNPGWQLTTPGKKMLRQRTSEHERPGADCAEVREVIGLLLRWEKDDAAQRKGRGTGSGGAPPDRRRSDGADQRLAADRGKRRSHPARRAGELSRLGEGYPISAQDGAHGDVHLSRRRLGPQVRRAAGRARRCRREGARALRLVRLLVHSSPALSPIAGPWRHGPL